MCTNYKINKLRFILGILFVPAFLPLGCTFNINITEIGDYPPPLIEPLPINAGVYYEKDFRTYESTQVNYINNLRETSKIKLGRANVALFDYIMSHNFVNVTPVQNFPNESANLKNIDLIVEPTISDYIYFERQVQFERSYRVRMEYTINFYSVDGQQISTWMISGESFRSTGLPGIEELSGPPCVKLTQLAMREVATQFFAGFCNERGIKKLFNEQCKQ